MSSPSLEDLEEMDPDEINAAVSQLVRCDPVAFLQAIASLIDDYQ